VPAPEDGIAAGVQARPSQAAIVGRIINVGFGSGVRYYRVGAWLPIVVELRLESPPSRFSGLLRIEQPDRDRDLIATERPVTLTAGAPARRIWLYTLANPDGPMHPFVVRILNDAGEAVPIVSRNGVPSPWLEPPHRTNPLWGDQSLILDISPQPTQHLERLLTDERIRPARDLAVARVGLDLLPDQWYGLEMAEYVFWDRADASRLRPAQIAALKTWVRFGGTLILAAGATGPSLAHSGLAELLPVEISGAAVTTEPLSQARATDRRRRRTDRNADRAGPRPSPLTYCRLAPRPGAQVVATDPALEGPLAVRWSYGRGQVVFIGAEIRELFPRSREASRFLARVFPLRMKSADDPSQARVWGFAGDIDLSGLMRNVINFHETTWAYQLVALLFVAGYVLAATVLNWRWLKKRQRLHHSWLTFGLVAAGASVLSLGAVRVLHGVGRTVRQFSIIDAEAGSYAASGVGYFGVKSASHTFLDLWLPSNYLTDDPDMPTDCFLRPVPPARSLAGVSFAAPKRYRLRPAAAILEHVPVRATLKQLEGYWNGQLSGQLQASIRIAPVKTGPDEPTRWLVSQDSWIRNGLGVTLRDCYLLVARADPVASPGRTEHIDVYEIRRIEAANRRQTMRELLYAEGAPPLRIPNTLTSMHQAWAARLARFGAAQPDRQPAFEPQDYARALMLLTTLREYAVSAGEVTTGAYYTVLPRPSGEIVFWLECSDMLTKQTALLVGFADDPGPIRLCVRTGGRQGGFRPLSVSRAVTAYRIRIPVVR